MSPGPTAPAPSPTTTVYVGEITFEEADGMPPCTAPLRLTFVGDTLQDFDIYTGAAMTCTVVLGGMSVHLEQARIHSGRSDGTRVAGTLDLRTQDVLGRRAQESLAWEGPTPTPATGFQARTLKGFESFSSIHWNLNAE